MGILSTGGPMAATERTQPLIEESDHVAEANVAMLQAAAAEDEVQNATHQTPAKHNLLRHARLLVAPVIAGLAIAACGSSGNSSGGAESSTTTTPKAEQPAQTKPPTKKVVHFVSTTILPKQQLDETIYAVLSATKKPRTQTNVAKVERFLTTTNTTDKLQAFVPGSHETLLKAQHEIVLPVRPGREYNAYKKGLHKQMVKVAQETDCTALPITDTPSSDTSFQVNPSCVTATQLGASWHAGCPVQPDQLKALTMDYMGTDKNTYKGTLIVNAALVNKVTKVFATLFKHKVHIHQMIPMSVYNGDAATAAAQDNTSGFNCPLPSPIDPSAWSDEAYGMAIDVNPVENPDVSGAQVTPAAGAAYLKRTDARPGMAILGKSLDNAMAAVGAQWGGAGTGTNYQHFTLSK